MRSIVFLMSNLNALEMVLVSNISQSNSSNFDVVFKCKSFDLIIYTYNYFLKTL